MQSDYKRDSQMDFRHRVKYLMGEHPTHKGRRAVSRRTIRHSEAGGDNFRDASVERGFHFEEGRLEEIEIIGCTNPSSS